MATYSIFTTESATDPNAPAKDGISVSGAATHYSKPWTGKDADGYSSSIFYTGTPTGAFTMWGTDKPNPSLADDTDWIQDTTFVPVNPAGAAGKFGDDAGNSKKALKRLKYVNSGGSGVVTGYVNVPKG